MLKRLYYQYLLLILICPLLLAGSITWEPMVINGHYRDQPTSSYLYQAVKLNYPQALLHYYRLNPDWSLSERARWLSHRAIVKLPATDYQQGLNYYQSGQTARARLWLNSGWQKGHVAAGVLLARLQLAQGEYQSAKKTLSSVALKDDSEAKLLLAETMLQSSEIAAAQKLLMSLPQNNMAKNLLVQIENKLTLHFSAPNNQCAVKLQFVVAGYHELTYAESLLNQWQQESAMSALPVCFKQPIIFKPQHYQCRDLRGEQQQCDLTLMAKRLALPDDVIPLVIYGSAGVANYSNGIIYLNRHKSYQVFKHELFHHFGFVDEYPLTKSVAARVCRGEAPYFSGENLYIVAQDQVDKVNWQQVKARWQQKFNDSFNHITAVSSCKDSGYVAYKPIAELTLMQYMDQPLPVAYILRAQQKMFTEPETFANYQYAYALAYDQLGDLNGYRYWLEQSAAQGYLVANRLLNNMCLKSKC